MNTRLTKNLVQTIGGVFVPTVLICVGMLLYSQWDLKRFKESLGELPAALPMAAPQTEREANIHTEETTSAEITAPKSLTQPHIEPESSKELEMEVSSLEILDSLIAELSPSELEALEEMVAEENLEEDKDTQVDEFQADIDMSSITTAGFISALESGNIVLGTGDPEAVATVIEILKRSTEGPITIDDQITMFEAWSKIQPDASQGQSMVNVSRDALTAVLLQLRAEKEKSLQSGEDTKQTVEIEVQFK